MASKQNTNDKKLDCIYAQQEVLENYMDLFKNLPMFTRNIMGEVPDMYGLYCEEEITESEVLDDKDKYINLLLSFIDFMWREMQTDYDNLEDVAERLLDDEYLHMVKACLMKHTSNGEIAIDKECEDCTCPDCFISCEMMSKSANRQKEVQ